MSLLNDVLRDLQARGAYGVQPLTGLEAVAGLATRQRRRAYMLPALVGLSVASALLLWRPAIDGQWLPSFSRVVSDANTRPQSRVLTAPKPSFRSELVMADAGDDSSGVIPIVRSGTPGPAARDDHILDTPSAVAAPSTSAAAVSPVTTTVLRRESRHESKPAGGAVTSGLTAMRGNDLVAAERFFREALAADSGDAAVWSYLYSVLVRKSHTAAAEQALRAGLIAAKEPAPLAKLYARMLLDRGEKGAAVSMLQAHRPVSASDTEYDAFLAALLQQLGRYADAGEIYRALLALDQSSAPWWIGLGISQDSLGNPQDALSAFERAQRAGTLNPTLAKYARRRISTLKTHE